MAGKIIKLSQLRVGQRFSFIPSDWYGQCRLTEKTKQVLWVYSVWGVWKSVKKIQYNIKFRANVVNPPGVIYGCAAETKVRLLSPKPRTQSKGYRAGYIV